ncbi:MAG: SCP2 sterol-binding domain-containing protein [Sphingobacteriales bacterium]|nr:SCP2 sterol-binding domain-containing protein [Sphingobacteriales bacterium]
MQKASDIIKSLPQRFKPERAEDGMESIFHFDISGDEGGEFTVELKDGNCTVSEGLHGTANCVVKAKDEVYSEIELGKRNPQMAIFMGQLKISNLGEMMRFIGLFERLYKKDKH